MECINDNTLNPAKTKLEISIVIPYYKGRDYIHACLASLENSTANCRIYIVDNDVVNLRAPNSRHPVTIIKTKPQIGYGRAANVAVMRAIEDGADILVVSNQDVKFLPDTLQNLCGAIKGDSKLIINTPIILDYDLERVSTFFKSQVLDSTDYLNDVSNSRGKDHYKAAGAYGTCFAFSARLYSEVGLFDPIFHMYGEDEDFFERVRRAGGEVRFIPGARLGHFHNHVNASGRDKTQIKFWAQNAHRILAIRYKKITLPGQFMRTFKDSVKYLLRGDIKFAFSLPIHHVKYFVATKFIRNTSLANIKQRIDTQIAIDLIAEDK